MVKNILSLLLGLSILGYGGYHSIKLSSLSKPKLVSNNSSNIDLSEEKWVKPVVESKAPAPVAPPAVKSPAKKTTKKAKKPEAAPTCTVGSGRFKVQSTGKLNCGTSSKGK